MRNVAYSLMVFQDAAEHMQSSISQYSTRYGDKRGTKYGITIDRVQCRVFVSSCVSHAIGKCELVCRVSCGVVPLEPL